MKTLLLATVASLALSAPAFAAGSMTVTFKDDVTTLDPAIGYDWQNWSMIKTLFSRLMDYKPGTTELVPSLAESFEVAPDGLSYTFKLRSGVAFTTGRAVTSKDVKYSIERSVNPKTQGPAGGFYAAIKGHAELVAGTAEGLEGIETPDDATVVFKLTRPDATFLHVMALNFSSVVPKEAVDAAGADFGKKPVGSGSFSLKEWTLGQKLVFAKNPTYFQKGLPKLDEITIEVGQEPTVAILRLQQGEVDIAGDGIPPSKFTEIRNAAEFKELIVEGKQLHTGYITLNVKKKPFDDVRVRKALAMAVNKERIVRILNGRAVAATQPLPPLMSGYDTSYKGQGFDPAAAKKLLAEAGLADGFSTVLYAANTDPQPRIAQAVQQDLAAIGVKVEIRALAQANVIAAGGSEEESTMIWSGGMGWIADFPDPSNFYGPILGCAGAVPGGWNWSWYCNPEIEKQAVAADSMADPAKAGERAEAWKKIFTAIQDEAPWIPLFNENRFVVHSKRLKATEAVFVDPTWLINYQNLEVTE